jgi:hypothetical protein
LLPLHATLWRSLPATVLAVLPVATPVRSAAWLVPSRHERLPAAALGLHLPRFSPIHSPPWEHLSASACPWRSCLRLTPTARSRGRSYAHLALATFALPPPYEASFTHGVNPPADGEHGCQSSALGVSQNLYARQASCALAHVLRLLSPRVHSVPACRCTRLSGTHAWLPTAAAARACTPMLVRALHAVSCPWPSPLTRDVRRS